MLNLLKADFYRIIKSKITIVSLILAVMFPIMMSLLYLGVSKALESELSGNGQAMESLFTARSLIGSSFSLTSNFGLVLPIFAAIFVSSDLKNGTLRNKIICGHDRKSIFLSHLITSIVFYLVMIIIYSSLTALLSCLFFGYGMKVDVKELMYVLIIGLASFIFAATISTFFTLLIDSTPLAIVLTVFSLLALSIISALLQAIEKEELTALIYFIPLFANSNMGATILTNQIFIEGIISLALFSIINVSIGMLIFVKKDLK